MYILLNKDFNIEIEIKTHLKINLNFVNKFKIVCTTAQTGHVRHFKKFKSDAQDEPIFEKC